jgi:hypothetical protein
MIILKAIWLLIFTVLSLMILFGCLWLLRVAIEWWLDVDYVKKIKEWIDQTS